MEKETQAVKPIWPEMTAIRTQLEALVAAIDRVSICSRTPVADAQIEVNDDGDAIRFGRRPVTGDDRGGTEFDVGDTHDVIYLGKHKSAAEGQRGQEGLWAVEWCGRDRFAGENQGFEEHDGAAYHGRWPCTGNNHGEEAVQFGWQLDTGGDHDVVAVHGGWRFDTSYGSGGAAAPEFLCNNTTGGDGHTRRVGFEDENLSEYGGYDIRHSPARWEESLGYKYYDFEHSPMMWGEYIPATPHLQKSSEEPKSRYLATDYSSRDTLVNPASTEWCSNWPSYGGSTAEFRRKFPVEDRRDGPNDFESQTRNWGFPDNEQASQCAIAEQHADFGVTETEFMQYFGVPAAELKQAYEVSARNSGCQVLSEERNWFTRMEAQFESQVEEQQSWNSLDHYLTPTRSELLVKPQLQKPAEKQWLGCESVKTSDHSSLVNAASMSSEQNFGQATETEFGNITNFSPAALGADYPSFSGENVKSWVHNMNALFELNSIPVSHRFQLVHHYLEGRAVPWYKSIVSCFSSVDWEELCDLAILRFGSDDEIDELIRLREAEVIDNGTVLTEERKSVKSTQGEGDFDAEGIKIDCPEINFDKAQAPVSVTHVSGNNDSVSLDVLEIVPGIIYSESSDLEFNNVKEKIIFVESKSMDEVFLNAKNSVVWNEVVDVCEMHESGLSLRGSMMNKGNCDEFVESVRCYNPGIVESVSFLFEDKVEHWSDSCTSKIDDENDAEHKVGIEPDILKFIDRIEKSILVESIRCFSPGVFDSVFGGENGDTKLGIEGYNLVVEDSKFGIEKFVVQNGRVKQCELLDSYCLRTNDHDSIYLSPIWCFDPGILEQYNWSMSHFGECISILPVLWSRAAEKRAEMIQRRLALDFDPSSLPTVPSCGVEQVLRCHDSLLTSYQVTAVEFVSSLTLAYGHFHELEVKLHLSGREVLILGILRLYDNLLSPNLELLQLPLFPFFLSKHPHLYESCQLYRLVCMFDTHGGDMMEACAEILVINSISTLSVPRFLIEKSKLHQSSKSMLEVTEFMCEVKVDECHCVYFGGLLSINLNGYSGNILWKFFLARACLGCIKVKILVAIRSDQNFQYMIAWEWSWEFKLQEVMFIKVLFFKLLESCKWGSIMGTLHSAALFDQMVGDNKILTAAHFGRCMRTFKLEDKLDVKGKGVLGIRISPRVRWSINFAVIKHFPGSFPQSKTDGIFPLARIFLVDFIPNSIIINQGI